MFVDAAAIVAILSEEEEAGRCTAALDGRKSEPVTSPIAVWEAAMALSRKLDTPLELSGRLVTRFLDDRGVAVINLPEPQLAIEYSLHAAERYRKGSNKLNLADCFHYACAKALGVLILSTAEEFRSTDIATIP
ncbi:MAG: type II toxin-antitoxin system VapC family toxin [Salaquimonas sp.]|jgi:ribonuclease VapC|nr:type II toxin-antitoxin system VapC family toxin [Salaquimonas sp.]